MSRLVALLALASVAGCARPADPPVSSTIPATESALIALPEHARDAATVLANGVAFLVARQSPDGAWRSDVYATFKDGSALTPLVVCALLDAADAGTTDPKAAVARRKGSDYLATFARPGGTIATPDGGFDYPVYTAALAAKALSHPENAGHAKARDAWVKYLLDRQLTAKLRWAPGDKQFGGWGYCRVIPTKPEPNALAPPLIESNLSATVFALDALRAAGVTDAAVYRDAAYPLARFHNYAPPVAHPLALPHFDGGFHFVYDDPVRNKAGPVGEGADGYSAFHSYGSATADGLRGLGYCGCKDDERKQAAANWLVTYFRADGHPGQYVAAHERNRDAVYFYYAASVSRAFREHALKLPAGRDWAGELAGELERRQRPDGSWANPVELVRENDPLVATGNAVIALALALARPRR